MASFGLGILCTDLKSFLCTSLLRPYCCLLIRWTYSADALLLARLIHGSSKGGDSRRTAMLLVTALPPSTTGHGTSSGLSFSRSVLRRAEVSRRKAQFSEEVIVLVVLDARRRRGLHVAERAYRVAVIQLQPLYPVLASLAWLDG